VAAPVRTPFTSDEVSQLKRLASLGLNNEQIASYFGINKRTLERRVKYSEGAVEALEQGRASAIEMVSRTAFHMATSGDVPAMTMFWLKCRAGWREVQKIEHTGEEGKPIQQKIEMVVRDYREE
jgi:hypothetical protein